MAEPKTRDGLPEWDLGDLYPARDGPEVDAELTALGTEVAAFAERHRSKIDALDGQALAAALEAYEALQDRIGRLGSYAGLVFATDMSDGANVAFYQSVNERLNAITGELLFFTLELNRLEDSDLTTLLQAPGVAHYQPWIRDVRVMRQIGSGQLGSFHFGSQEVKAHQVGSGQVSFTEVREDEVGSS